ncbi:hypothetical protein [Actinomadura hibisca]|uniref:hypothetical protein n=1 Tax=Actinomadura hibisca TaxID=68565 RepID=UPI0008364A69|nr:hypothetical protein [Actinomadura hibisca]
MTTATGPVAAVLPVPPPALLPALLAALAVAALLATARRRGPARPASTSAAPPEPSAPSDTGALPEAGAFPGSGALADDASQGASAPQDADASQGSDAAPHSGGSEYPESLTAVLEPEAEEYLAWLADHHWPADEYLELEEHWRHEIDPFETPDPADIPLCPQCRLRREDVWPCPQCGRLLHSSCGHGMRRRRVDRPYQTRATDSEAVIAEWVCTGCTSVVGLDVGHDDEPGGGLLR